MEKKERSESSRQSEASAKKPYRRPEILYRETLEAMAALCTPSPPAKSGPGTCPAGPISS